MIVNLIFISYSFKMYRYLRNWKSLSNGIHFSQFDYVTDESVHVMASKQFNFNLKFEVMFDLLVSQQSNTLMKCHIQLMTSEKKAKKKRTECGMLSNWNWKLPRNSASCCCVASISRIIDCVFIENRSDLHSFHLRFFNLNLTASNLTIILTHCLSWMTIAPTNCLHALSPQLSNKINQISEMIGRTSWAPFALNEHEIASHSL